MKIVAIEKPADLSPSVDPSAKFCLHLDLPKLRTDINFFVRHKSVDEVS